MLLKSSITFWILSWPSSSSKRATGIVSSDVVTWSSYLSLLTLLSSTALSINTYILVFVLDWQHIVWLCCKNYIYIILSPCFCMIFCDNPYIRSLNFLICFPSAQWLDPSGSWGMPNGESTWQRQPILWYISQPNLAHRKKVKDSQVWEGTPAHSPACLLLRGGLPMCIFLPTAARLSTVEG